MITSVLNEKGGIKELKPVRRPGCLALPILVRDTFWKNMSDAAAVMRE